MKEWRVNNPGESEIGGELNERERALINPAWLWAQELLTIAARSAQSPTQTLQDELRRRNEELQMQLNSMVHYQQQGIYYQQQPTLMQQPLYIA